MANNNRKKNGAPKAIAKTTNLTPTRGNAGKNKAQSILRQLREGRSLPTTIYGRNGSPLNMNARQRREWASQASGRKLNSRYHVHFTPDKKLRTTTSSGGIRRTLEGYRVSYTYS